MQQPLYMMIAPIAIAATLAVPTPVRATDALATLHGSSTEASQELSSCTMAVPPARATVEAEIANAADFCELVSHALAAEVFRTPVLVTPALLWHYADAALSCRLRYGETRYRMTIHNSRAACRWLKRLAPKWNLETSLAADCPDRACVASRRKRERTRIAAEAGPGVKKEAPERAGSGTQRKELQ